MKLNSENKVKKFTLALIISCFAIASAHAGGIGDNRYKDSDWNTSMYNWDNDYLHGQDIEWVKYNGDQALQFTLEGGKPGIRDDDRPTRWGAKFRERNELFSDFFTWPNISGSPIIIESIPVITFKECLNASVPAYRYWSFFLRFSNLFKILETTFSKFFISDLEQTE